MGTSTAIGLSAVRSGRKRSHSEPTASAEMEALPSAKAEMTAEKTGRVSKRFKLCTVVKGTSIPLDLKNKAYKGFKTKPLEKIWDEAQKLLPEGATDLRINYSNLTIRYRDNSGAYQYIDLRDSSFQENHVEFMKLVQKVRSMAKKVWKDLGFATHFNDLSNRSRNGPRPFEICSSKWREHMPKSLSEFLKKGHMQTLADHLERSHGNVNTAFSRIAATEEFLQRLQNGVQNMRSQVERFTKDPNFRTQPKEAREEAQKALKDLEELERELFTMDRFALYWAIGMWGDRDPSTISREDRFRLADDISMAVEVALTHELKPGVDNRWFASWRGDQEGQQLLGMGPFVKAYAMDVGDAIVHDRLDAIERADDAGEMVKGASLVEFIVHNMIHSQNPDFDQAAAIDSIGYRFSREIRQDLSQIVQNSAETARSTGNKAAQLVQYRVVPWSDLTLEGLL